MNKTILNDENTYYYWRDKKLEQAGTSLDNSGVEIKNPLLLSNKEKDKMTQQLLWHNFVLYQFDAQRFANHQAVLAINQQLGLVDYDKHLYANSNGLANICLATKTQQQDFIPYTNKVLNWHTDGYYNQPPHRIRSFSLFCAKQADIGGENAWIDHEIVYILLREKTATLAQALTQNNAMVVPEYRINNEIYRPQSVGAIFFIDKKTKHLMMRYTQRKHNIIWSDNTSVQQAKIALSQLLDSTTKYHYFYKMQKGQGLICHNIPHKRNSFHSNKKNGRLMIRGRYFNRVIA